MSTFRGSETSGATVTVYSHRDEPLIADLISPLSVSLKDLDGDGRPDFPHGRSGILRIDSRQGGVSADVLRLVSVSTTKSLDGAPGRFTFAVKTRGLDFAGMLSDDDWVDIEFTRHDKNYHVMRGLIDTISPKQAVGGDGATEYLYVVAGSDFTKIFKQTPIWFDRITDNDYAGAAITRILDATKSLYGSVRKTVKAVLYGFLQVASGKGRGTWVLPPTLAARSSPDITVTETGVTVKRQRVRQGSAHAQKSVVVDPSGVSPLSSKDTVRTAVQLGPTQHVQSFIDVLTFYDDNWINDPPRSAAISPTLFNPGNQDIWRLASSFADPALCEFYCDLLQQDGPVGARYFRDEEESTPATTTMAVILRDRPFPTLTRHVTQAVTAEPDLSNEEDVLSGPWFRGIATYTVSRSDCTAIDVARSGAERLNAFFASPVLFQELVAATPELQTPLLNRDDVRRHGVRRLDVVTNYTTSADDKKKGNTPLGMALTYRQRVRDFYCLNHLFYSGTIALARGRPDIHIGGRVRIPGNDAEDPNEAETYYVEQVSHTWALAAGMRTQLGVTRGWRGSDNSLVRALNTMRSNYNDNDLQAKFDKIMAEISARIPGEQ